MKKGDVGMAKHFSKKYGNKGWALYLQSEINFCSVRMIVNAHPYITASRTIINIVLSWVELGHWTLTDLLSTLQKRGCHVYVISFLYSKCSTFKAAWVCGQSYASISHNPTKCA